MKDYNEVAAEILNRRDQHAANRKRQLKHTCITLSCFCFAALFSFGIWGLFDRPAMPDTQPDSGKSTALSAPADTLPAEPVILPAASMNHAAVSTEETAEIALISSDWRALSYDELLNYYGVKVPVEELFSGTLRRRQSDSYGIYQSNARGVYYDKNHVIFEDGTALLSMGFSKAAHRPGHFLTLMDSALQFTQINGRQLALFQYTDDAGNTNYYTELLQDGIGWYVGAAGMGEEDFLRVLTAVVSTVSSEPETHTISGTAVAVDAYAGIIGIESAEQGITYTVWLPDGFSADKYDLGTQVSVTYRGQPATIQNIWAEQIVTIE